MRFPEHAAGDCASDALDKIPPASMNEHSLDQEDSFSACQTHVRHYERRLFPLTVAVFIFMVQIYAGQQSQPDVIQRESIATFTPATVLIPPYVNIANPPSEVHEVCIVDLDKDGLNDIVVGTGFYIHVLTQLPNHALTLTKTYFTGLCCDLQVADLNNDGILDFAASVDMYSAALWGDSLMVLLRDANGEILSRKYYASPPKAQGIAVADYNGDGLNDILVAHQTGDFVQLFYQKPAGVFDSSTVIPTFFNYAFQSIVEAGDFNSDGKMDFVTNCGPWGYLTSYFVQNDSGRLVYAHSVRESWGIGELVSADMNGDGKMDAITINYSFDLATVYYQGAGGSLYDSTRVFSFYTCAQATEDFDVDHDGRRDIVTASGGWERATVYRQNEQGNLIEAAKLALPYESHYYRHSMATGDVNGDGREDIVIASPQAGILVFYNQTKQLTDVDDVEMSPTTFAMSNYPNPFNPVTTIQLDLPRGGRGRLSVYDMLGREVEVLADEEWSAGVHRIQWNASRFESGVYFARLMLAGKGSEHPTTRVQKLVLTK